MSSQKLLQVFLVLMCVGCGEKSPTPGQPGSPQNIAKAGTGKESAVQSRLRDLAVEDLHKSKYSGARAEALCDTVSEETYDPVSYGVIRNSPEVLGDHKPLPAVVMRHQYTCVNRTFATKDKQEQWVILALDDEFKMVRCLRTGPLSVVAQLASTCAFSPDSGKSPFPGAPDVATSAIPKSDGSPAASKTEAVQSTVPSAASKASTYLEPYRGSYGSQCQGQALVTVKADSVLINQDGKTSQLSDLDIDVSFFGRSPPEGFSFAALGRKMTSGENVILLFWDGKKGPEVSVGDSNAPHLARCP